MNKKLLYALLALVAFVCGSCSTDNVSSGESLLDERDRIVVGVDTFGTCSFTLDIANRAIDDGILPDSFPIYSTPDSFLLGECDSRFGTLHADILAQFACPEGFEYPAGAEIDSVCLFFYYGSWFGDGYSPMSIDIFPLKTVLLYDQPYSHNLNIDEFVDPAAPSVLERQRILVAAEPTDSAYDSQNRVYRPYVRCRLTDEFARTFFQSRDFSSQTAFSQSFPGLYLKSNFGGSTLLHVSDINLAVYYHYSYEKAGRDTTVTDVKGFYANSEVRQVNRYVYFTDTDTEEPGYDRASLLADETKNYIVAPANLYTRISLPIKEMATNILSKLVYTRVTENGTETLYRRPYINKAAISLEVLNYYDGTTSYTRNDWAQPAANMLLIKEESVQRFFRKHELPSDTCAILASVSAEKVTDTDSIRYFYTYDLSTLLMEQLRKFESDTVVVPDSLHMILMPVSVSTQTTTSSSYYYSSSSSTTITGVKEEQIVSATEILSASNPQNPLSLEVVYSGF